MSETSNHVILEVHDESPPLDILEATLAAYAQIHDNDNPSASRLYIDTPGHSPFAHTMVGPHIGIEVPLPLRVAHPGPVTGVTISPYVSYPDLKVAEQVFGLAPNTAGELWLGIQHADREVKSWGQSALRHEAADQPFYAPVDTPRDILGLSTTTLTDMAATLLLKPETFGYDRSNGEQIASEATLLLAVGREALREPPQDDQGHETAPALRALLEWKEQAYEVDSIDRLDIRSRWLNRLRKHNIHRLSRGVGAVLTAQFERYQIQGLNRRAERAILLSGLPQLPNIRAGMIQAIADATDEALSTTPLNG